MNEQEIFLKKQAKKIMAITNYVGACNNLVEEKIIRVLKYTLKKEQENNDKKKN